MNYLLPSDFTTSLPWEEDLIEISLKTSTGFIPEALYRLEMEEVKYEELVSQNKDDELTIFSSNEEMTEPSQPRTSSESKIEEDLPSQVAMETSPCKSKPKIYINELRRQTR